MGGEGVVVPSASPGWVGGEGRGQINENGQICQCSEMTCSKISRNVFFWKKKPLRECPRQLKACKNLWLGPRMTQKHTNTHFSKKGLVTKCQERVFFFKAPAGAP